MLHNARPQPSSHAISKPPSLVYKRPVLPEASQALPDVMLHVDSCVFALHDAVLSLRWPWLHLQLQQLRHTNVLESDTRNQFQLQLWSSETEATMSSCPLQTVTLQKPLLYTRCLSTAHQRYGTDIAECRSEEDNKVSSIKKRQRENIQEKSQEQENEHCNLYSKYKKRPRKLFTSKKIHAQSCVKVQEVLHVELVGSSAMAVVPVVEYVYTFKVRLLHGSSARQTLQLAQWVRMSDRLPYSCLKIAVRKVTVATWMELLLATSRLSDDTMRRALCDRLVGFIYELEPAQYQDAMDKIPTMWLQMIDDHDMLVRVVIALINNVRLIGFWRNVLDGLVRWLQRRFPSPQLPSLRAIHCSFASDWEPYVELSRIECFSNTASTDAVPLHVTLFEFGDFVLQACINAKSSMPMLWRVIRRDSPHFYSEDNDVIVDVAALKKDPEFWIRGQLVIKYQPSHLGGDVVAEETRIEYQHCRRQYCQWRALVSPSKLPPSIRVSSPSEEGWVLHEDPDNNYYRRTMCTVSGKLFLWGDPVCSLYHYLLHSTLFYCAPNNVNPEVAEIVSVSKMQQLPMDTLTLVLCSDRLRVPDGEKTLLRCVNQMVFGLDVYHLKPDVQLPLPYQGRAENASRLYRCIRWCFVPVDNIIQTLRWSSRELKLYEIIVEGLKDPNRSIKRRRPWGWRKYRDAYMTNETNLIEFEIEAGDLNLSPKSTARRELSRR